MPVIDGVNYSTGLIPRDYQAFPPGCYAGVPVAPNTLLLPEPEWAERLKEQQANQASLWDLREANYDTLKSLDQDGEPLCWCFSTTKAVMYTRAVMGAPPQRLSAWWLAGKAANWRSVGGWGTKSLEAARQYGIPEEPLCPSYNSRYDTTEVAANAAQHKVIEWYEGTDDRDFNRSLMISMFLLGLSGALDYNHLSHSMAGCCLKSINPLVILTDNSWGATNQYGPKGCYELRGNLAIPDGIAVAAISQPAP